MKTAENHVQTLRIRLRLLEDVLLPQARTDRHKCLSTWEDERDALIWVLRHWDASRRVVDDPPPREPSDHDAHGGKYIEPFDRGAQVSDDRGAQVSDDRPSIAELAALREGWPATLTPVLDGDGTWDGKFDHSDNEDGEDGEGYIECSSMDEAPRFAALIAVEHNAVPVLIEIVAAALEWQATYGAPRGDRHADRAEAALLIALAKVRP
jgi:hypothetical protein